MAKSTVGTCVQLRELGLTQKILRDMHMNRILGKSQIYQPPLKRLRILGPRLALIFWGSAFLSIGALLKYLA